MVHFLKERITNYYAIAMGIVFLMTFKPDLKGSLLAIAVAAVLGLVTALPAVASGRSKQPTT